MKKLKNILILFLISLLFIPSVQAKENKVKLYLFYSSTCPHCAKEKKYLKELEKKYDNLKIYKYEVSEGNNSHIFELVDESLNDKNQYVPYTIIGTYSLVGFNEDTKDKIVKYIEECSKYECYDLVGQVKKKDKNLREEVLVANEKLKEEKEQIKKEETKETEEENEKLEEDKSTMNIPILGKFDAKKISLPFISIFIGLLDGFNPCAMWVLVFLISMLIGMKNRKRMWIIGLTFLITSALIYLLFMLSIFKISNQFIVSSVFQKIIAIIAIIGAIINLRNYTKERKQDAGCQVVDKEKRINIINKIKKFTSEKNIILAMLGAITLAISVNFVELACTAGLPTVFIQILALNNIEGISVILYMVLYMLAYLLDDLVVFIIAMITMKLTGITNKYNKFSHLIGGIVMLIFGILMIFKPEWIMMNF